ncbi:subtilisin-like protease SBT6.1 [Magnolia sinica]|uniref:subtilisin-like protease SBT6.1 n=1 Tax=Magnolia sinica TaxID=86752 RepID=UPI0026598C3B|nr:subtilisin-like protease SBT6.1 [Magnolia sinica]
MDPMHVEAFDSHLVGYCHVPISMRQPNMHSKCDACRYGRVKPDVAAYGRDIMGSKISTGCKSLSGTSVARPVVAGVVCLLTSIISEGTRKDVLYLASMKQALVEGAAKLSGPNMYEQGAGRLDLLESYEILKSYQPRASIFPSILDYTDCPYSWPFCRQPLYAGAIKSISKKPVLVRQV